MDKKSRSLRIFAEIMRRKGKTVRDAQTWAGEEPWYTPWIWDEREEKAFDRWFKSWCVRTLHVSAKAFEHDRWISYLSFYLHRRDNTRTDPRDHHDDAAERDLPRAKWLCEGCAGRAAKGSVAEVMTDGGTVWISELGCSA